MRVTVTAYARLHLGFLNVDESLGWVHGSLGVGLDTPRIRIVAEPAETFGVTGEQADKVARYAERLGAALGTAWPARLRVEEAIAEHSGLGSGTQWALAVGTALTRLRGTPMAPRELAALLGRGMRSGIGVASFEAGGCVMEAGHLRRRPDEPVRPSAVVLRRDFPAGWRFVLVMPEAGPGLSGQAERDAFAGLGETAGIADAVCRIVLLRLLPALIEEDIVAFGRAISDLDRHTGLFFKQAQGGVYRDAGGEIVEGLLSAGAYGVGQSSWGPCLYALVDDANEAGVVAAARAQLAETGTPGGVFVARARNTGADVVVED
ncbi:MAG: beta-ribofuranosylaminobenzene 5'-phosphate synthase family protein [Solidesulfovibrio sp.]|uniref:beta-ribofuranosylaminobenzene 5'-phosphate synthase family protein n=1 Tax=Solidesulfovibrio sp. TaxID=2910990 RepID=UPI002B22172D|nr:beta-ribofuranosylaminobenzene 5'-phosphate synthase family protein [Solidesulfovibrio sp.]MEA4855455.1 beta-ribofuranosylaminobenzene 5'-phosphate synthase family protein [Solidesulfovibrio sp.]